MPQKSTKVHPVLHRLTSWLAPSERSTFVAAALAFGTLAAAALVARAAGTGLFVAAWGAERMPLLYLGSAAFVLGAASVLLWLLSRWQVEILLQRLSLAVAVLVLGIRLLAFVAPRPASIATFLAADLIAQLLVALFWALASRVFDPRQSRRLLGPLGASATVACILAGAAIAPSAEAVGTENLLWGVMALLLGTAFVSRTFVERSKGIFRPGSLSRPGILNSLTTVFDRPLARSIGLLVALSAATLVVVDYVFVQRLGATTTRDGFAAYYGSLYSKANLGALVIQLLVAAPLLRWGGVQLGLAVLPGSLLLVSTGALVTGGFSWIALAKAHEPLFLFTVHAMALQMLYHGVRLEVRDRVRAAIDGLLRPATVIVTGLLLLVLGPRLQLPWLLAIVPVLTILWLWSTRLNVARYLEGLVISLQTRRLDSKQTALDAETVRVLIDQWRSAPPAEKPYLLALVEELGAKEVIGVVASELSTLEPELRERALRLMEDSHQVLPTTELERFATDAEPGVRMAALRLLLTQDRERNQDPPLLKESSAKREADSSGSAEAEAARQVAKWRAGDQSGPSLGDPPSPSLLLVQLLDLAPPEHAKELYFRIFRTDPDELSKAGLVVRRAALQSLARRPIADLLPAILADLEEPGLISAAEAAIRAIGVEKLVELLPHEDRELREDSPRGQIETSEGWADLPEFGAGDQKFLRLLGETRDPRCFRYLRERFENSSARDVEAIAKTLFETCRSQPKGSVERTWSRLATRKLLALGATLERQSSTLARFQEAKATRAALEEENQRRSAAALWLAGLGFSLDIRGETLYEHLKGTDPSQKARTLEILDNALDRKTRTLVEVLFTSPSKEDPITTSLESQNTLQEIALSPTITAPTRGASLLALLDLAPEQAQAVAQHLLRESDSKSLPGPLVEAARWVVDGVGASERTMHSMITYERAARLGQIELFQGLQPSILADLAQRSTERVLSADEVLFEVGDKARSMYLLVNGKVKVHRQQRVLAELSAGDHFGEMSLLDDETRSATVTALEDSILLRIRRDDFRDLLADHFDASLAVMKSLSARLRATSSQ